MALGLAQPKPFWAGGVEGNRTPHFLIVNEALVDFRVVAQRSLTRFARPASWPLAFEEGSGEPAGDAPGNEG